MKNNFFAMAAMVAVFSMVTGLANAADVWSGLPNNTQTQLANAISDDGVVVPTEAYVFRHLYGQELIVKLKVKDLGFEKVFYVQGLDGTRRAPFVENEGEFRSGGTKALWVGKEGEFDVIFLKVSGNTLVSYRGEVNFHRFHIYLQMAGAEFVARDIEIK